MIAIQQYFNLFGLNQSYIETVAGAQGRIGLLHTSRPRAVGMIGNPNELGFLFAVAALIAAYFLTQRFRFGYVLLLATNLGGIALTGSRSSLIACAAGMLVLAVAGILRGRGIRLASIVRALTLALGVVLAGVAMPATELSDGLLWRFGDLSDPMQASSWQGRLVRWEDNLELFEASPLLGVGPLRRTDDMQAADNEWLLLLRSYGIVGTSVLVLAFLLPYWRSAFTAVRALSGAVLLASAVYMIPAAVFHPLALMPVVLIVVALGETRLRIKVLSGAGGRAWPRERRMPIRNDGRLQGAAGTPHDP